MATGLGLVDFVYFNLWWRSKRVAGSVLGRVLDAVIASVGSVGCWAVVSRFTMGRCRRVRVSVCFVYRNYGGSCGA